ncbi:MAG TPA: type I DNA topoisomerase [Acidimicrobiales bacterium]
MAKSLVIVESPAKAKTIAGFLGSDYVVEASFGHIRDLPRDAKQIPAAFKGEPWARLGVDVDNDFKPLYVISDERQTQVKKLRGLLKGATEVFLATDEDREGESIAWHLLEVLAPQVPVQRMVFHEITPAAIAEALAHPRELDRRLVDAQEARRILDRLYGYELSPLLWKKVMPRLSAGRVQSVATRIVVERERERMAFRSASWWSLAGQFATGDGESFAATLAVVDGKKVADGGDFDALGAAEHPEQIVLLDDVAAGELATALTDAPFSVLAVEDRPYRRSPAAPFITSTLQQEAARKLRFSAQQAMRVAQRLYEQGYITYMRTDSTTLSQTALDAARSQAATLYGKDNVSARPRTYDRKVRNAQEAHEAIRPAGDNFRTPRQVAAALANDELRLYELIWQRTLASQMIDATGVTARVRLSAATTSVTSFGAPGVVGEFVAAGTVITSPGFLRVYSEGDDETDDAPARDDVRLPALTQGEAVELSRFDTEDHATRPPARFTEASLVKRLEELGVGRPSTYASIMQTIQDRGYVWKKGTALIPSFTAFAVTQLLEEHFSSLVDYSFTAKMEDDLDEIANGTEEAVPWLERFYFGPRNGKAVDPAHEQTVHATGLKQAVLDHLAVIDARLVNSIPIGSDGDGEEVVARVGRYGPYVQKGDARASIPEDLPPDELTLERALEILSAPSGDRELGIDPATGQTIIVRAGRFGPYVQVGEAEGKEKPRTASLFKSMTTDSVTLAQSLQLLELPREIGADEAGVEVVARNGRYGPYIQRGSDSRSLDSEDLLLSIDIEAALALLAQPKQRRFGQSASSAHEVGPDPESGKMITLRSGKFGPYVTDGTTNASLRRGDSEEDLTLERAIELLVERRASAPAGARPRRGAAKKAPAKKVAAKKAAAKKSPAKKVAAKKAAAKKVPAKRVATGFDGQDDPPF